MKLPYFYLNLYEIGVSEYHLKIIWKNHRKSIKCSHTRSEWFHIFSTDEGIASISYNPAVYVYEIFIYSSYTFIYFATVQQLLELNFYIISKFLGFRKLWRAEWAMCTTQLWKINLVLSWPDFWFGKEKDTLIEQNEVKCNK